MPNPHTLCFPIRVRCFGLKATNNISITYRALQALASEASVLFNVAGRLHAFVHRVDLCCWSARSAKSPGLYCCWVLWYPSRVCFDSQLRAEPSLVDRAPTTTKLDELKTAFDASRGGWRCKPGASVDTVGIGIEGDFVSREAQTSLHVSRHICHCTHSSQSVTHHIRRNYFF